MKYLFSVKKISQLSNQQLSFQICVLRQQKCVKNAPGVIMYYYGYKCLHKTFQINKHKKENFLLAYNINTQNYS